MATKFKATTVMKKCAWLDARCLEYASTGTPRPMFDAVFDMLGAKRADCVRLGYNLHLVKNQEPSFWCKVALPTLRP